MFFSVFSFLTSRNARLVERKVFGFIFHKMKRTIRTELGSAARPVSLPLVLRHCLGTETESWNVGRGRTFGNFSDMIIPIAYGEASQLHPLYLSY